MAALHTQCGSTAAHVQPSLKRLFAAAAPDGPVPVPVACRAARNALHTAVRRLERALLRELAKANQRRLLDFCRRLDAALDPAVPSSGAVARLLPGQRMAPEAAADGRGLLPGLDHNAAIVLAASCLLASDSCCSGGRPTSLQVGWLLRARPAC